MTSKGKYATHCQSQPKINETLNHSPHWEIESEKSLKFSTPFSGQKEMAPQSDFLGIMNQNGLGNKGIGSIFWHPICKRRVVKKKAIKLRNSSKFFIAKKVFESMISFF